MNKLNMNRKKGFTLIEVLITVAIIGILSTIYVPSKVNSIIRQQVKDSYYSMSELKIAIQEHYNKNNRNFPETTEDLLGIEGLTEINKEFMKIEVIDGQLVGTFSNNAIKNLINSNTKIVLTPYRTATSYINWHCEYIGENKDTFSPYDCKDNGTVYEHYEEPEAPVEPPVEGV